MVNVYAAAAAVGVVVAVVVVVTEEDMIHYRAVYRLGLRVWRLVSSHLHKDLIIDLAHLGGLLISGKPLCKGLSY